MEGALHNACSVNVKGGQDPAAASNWRDYRQRSYSTPEAYDEEARGATDGPRNAWQSWIFACDELMRNVYGVCAYPRVYVYKHASV